MPGAFLGIVLLLFYLFSFIFYDSNHFPASPNSHPVTLLSLKLTQPSDQQPRMNWLLRREKHEVCGEAVLGLPPSPASIVC